MKFIFGKWKSEQDAKAVKEQYGENGALMIRNRKPFKAKQEKVTHSFPHLLNKRFKVPVIKPSEFFSAEKPQRSFRITDAQKVQQAMRNSDKLKTNYDG